MKKFKIITFGCQMNEDDSNSISLFLKSNGFSKTLDEKKADIIIVNTCTVRQHAEERALSVIGSFKKIKRKEQKIFFIGCAAERIGEKLIKRKFPFIDYVIGAKEYHKIFEILKTEFIPQGIKKEFSSEKKITDYLTISRGCNLSCSYCIVPYVRGKETVVGFSEIIKSAIEKAKNGTKEIILLGQTVNSYYDREEKKDFTDLLREISKIDEIKIIRFLSPHPLFFNEKFFEEYKKNKKISRWIHLPLQSGSDKILKKMRRGYSVEKFKEIVNNLRKADPLTSITTDIIVGYTGETEEDFQMTIDLVKEIRFSMAYCFKYSPRFEERDPLTITKEELEKRHQILLSQVKAIAKEVIKEKVSSIEDVVCYSPQMGKTNSGYNCCIIDNNDRDFIKVLITDVKDNTLYGRVYEQEKYE